MNLDRMVSRGQYGMCRQHLWHQVYLGLDELSFNESLIKREVERNESYLISETPKLYLLPLRVTDPGSG